MVKESESRRESERKLVPPGFSPRRPPFSCFPSPLVNPPNLPCESPAARDRLVGYLTDSLCTRRSVNASSRHVRRCPCRSPCLCPRLAPPRLDPGWPGRQEDVSTLSEIVVYASCVLTICCHPRLPNPSRVRHRSRGRTDNPAGCSRLGTSRPPSPFLPSSVPVSVILLDPVPLRNEG